MARSGEAGQASATHNRRREAGSRSGMGGACPDRHTGPAQELLTEHRKPTRNIETMCASLAPDVASAARPRDTLETACPTCLQCVLNRAVQGRSV